MEELLDEFPEIKYVFGYLPLRYGGFLISLFGVCLGIVGLVGVLLYGIGAFDFLLYFMAAPNEDAKKVTIATVGLVSFFITVKNSFLIAAVIMKSQMFVYMYVMASLLMISILFMVFTGVPLSCFFGIKQCILNSISFGAFLAAIVFFSFILSSWTYFMMIGNSLRMEWK